MRNSQSLTRTLAGSFGGEEQVKYFMADFLRDTGTGITDTNFCPIIFVISADTNGALFRGVVAVSLGNGMGSIDNHI